MKQAVTIKMTAIILLLVLAIISSGVIAQKVLYNDSQRIAQPVEELEEYIKSEDWTKAGNSLSRVNTEWSKVKGKWSALVDHEEIDNIDVTLSRLQMFVMACDKASSLSEAAALGKFVGHIPEKELPNLKNIF
jgi:cell division protein FtsL